MLKQGGNDPPNESNEAKDPKALSKAEEDQSFEHLASTVRVLKIRKEGHMIMEEGQPGDLFYIILEGECAVFKATPVVIHSMIHEEAIQDRALAYFRVFMENYDKIFWAGMDITRNEIDDILGILRDNCEGGSGQIINLPEWPINQHRQVMLQGYVRRHEKDPSFKNSYGEPVLLVNQHLINLQPGAGFGELALMSDINRMATVITSTSPCTLATLTRKDFSNVMRRA